MAGQRYHVVPNKSDDGRANWKLKREGASQSKSRHRKKSAAIREGKKTAVRNRVGLVVHRSNGTVSHGFDYEGLKRSFPHLAPD